MGHHHGHAHHEAGTMDITQQEKTFAGFIRFSIKSIAVIACVLVFLAIFRT